MTGNHILEVYTDGGYKRIPGTEDWVTVLDLGWGGYDWTIFRAFYSPAARRYFWHGDSGNSTCDWDDNLDTSENFANGDRAALREALRAFAAEDWREDSFKADALAANATIADFKETP